MGDCMSVHVVHLRFSFQLFMSSLLAVLAFFPLNFVVGPFRLIRLDIICQVVTDALTS